jgi:large subunit ribosomal protein L4
MNKKERRLALATALHSAAADMVVVDSLEASLPETKTRAMVSALRALGADPETGKVLVVLAEASEAVYLAGRNIPSVAINTADAVQVYDVLGSDKIVVEAAALAYLNEFLGAPAPVA